MLVVNPDTETKKINLKFQMELVMKSTCFETGTPGEQLKGGGVTAECTSSARLWAASRVLAGEPPTFVLASVFWQSLWNDTSDFHFVPFNLEPRSS